MLRLIAGGFFGDDPEVLKDLVDSVYSLLGGVSLAIIYIYLDNGVLSKYGCDNMTQNR